MGKWWKWLRRKGSPIFTNLEMVEMAALQWFWGFGVFRDLEPCGGLFPEIPCAGSISTISVHF